MHTVFYSAFFIFGGFLISYVLFSFLRTGSVITRRSDVEQSAYKLAEINSRVAAANAGNIETSLSSRGCKKLTYYGLSEYKILSSEIGDPKKEKLSSYWIYNPSFLSFGAKAVGSTLYHFTARMSWLYGDADCSSLVGSKAMHYCSIAHKDKWQETSIAGVFDESSCTADVGGSILFNDIKDWNDGAGWSDTRLLSVRGDNKSDMVSAWITSQRSEYVRGVMWRPAPNNIDPHSLVLLQITSAAFYSGTKDIRSSKVFTRLIYYDPDPNHWTRSYTEKHLVGYKVDMASIAPVLCQRRNMNYSSAKSAKNTLRSPRKTNSTVKVRNNQKNSAEIISKKSTHANAINVFNKAKGTSKQSSVRKSSSTDRKNRRRLTDDGSIGCIKDKNWTPFVYRDRILWSYIIWPHIVCENDIDLRRQAKDASCAMCQRKYDSVNWDMWDAYSAQLMQKYDVTRSAGAVIDYHLNGVPAFRIVNEKFYLGVAHAFIKYETKDDAGDKLKHIIYAHFFYKMHPEPPFAIYAISKVLDLETDHSVAYWFKKDETTKVAFINGFEYIERDIGRELVISYGVGDSRGRIMRVGINEAKQLFDLNPSPLLINATFL